MSENLITIIITLVSVLFGAGGWKFYEFLIRNKREKQKEKRNVEKSFKTVATIINKRFNK